MFDYDNISTVNFGVCLEDDSYESYRLVPCGEDVQHALIQMLLDTHSAINEAGAEIREFSPAEKYGPTERLKIPLNAEIAEKHRTVFRADNLPTDSDGITNVSRIVSYFAIFVDADGKKLMAFKRAAQFKGVLKKRLITFTDDALRLVGDQVFKLDNDFDFLILDEGIFVWRPSAFVFTADIDRYVAASAASNVDQIAEEVGCVSFDSIKHFVSKHKLAMRLVAAIKSRNDLSQISKRRLSTECKKAGVAVETQNGKLVPADGNELGFLMLLDRRRYSVTLIEKSPETYEAESRHPTQSSVVVNS
jgi:hypothetical protein